MQVAAVTEQDQELSDASINAELLGVMLAGDASSATLKFKASPNRYSNAMIKLMHQLSYWLLRPIALLSVRMVLRNRL